MIEVVEYGATAIAVLYAIELTGYNTVERSVRGGGFDYWIGDYGDSNDPPFTKSERMEISGIFESDKSQIKSRLDFKKKQIAKSDSSGTPKVVFIMEFSNPLSAVEYSK